MKLGSVTISLCFPSKLFITGSFGRVRLCRNKKSGEFFAMKILKKADIIKLKQVDHVISENTILADIDHPFLVSLSGGAYYDLERMSLH